MGELLSGRGECEMTENIQAQTARRQLEESELGEEVWRGRSSSHGVHSKQDREKGLGSSLVELTPPDADFLLPLPPGSPPALCLGCSRRWRATHPRDTFCAVLEGGPTEVLGTPRDIIGRSHVPTFPHSFS